MNIVPYEIIDGDYLITQPSCIYVHDENMAGTHLRKIDSSWTRNERELSNRYGFITYIWKESISKKESRYHLFKLGEYADLVYPVEELLLVDTIKKNQDKFFLIDPLGYGVFNKYLSFDYVIKQRLYEALKPYDNGMLLWGDLETRYLTNK